MNNRSIKEAEAFIREFIAHDYSVKVANWTEPDDVAFHKKLDELNSNFSGRIESDIHRNPPANPSSMEEERKYLDSLQQKKLFMLKAYPYEGSDELFKAYLSSDVVGDDSFFSQYYFTRVDHVFKIISEYYICFDCETTGLIGRDICPACSGKGWLRQQGVEIPVLGHPSGIIKFQPPANPKHKLEYDME